jgi:acetyl-CoA carboxylase carboxyl transferase subunit beta
MMPFKNMQLKFSIFPKKEDYPEALDKKGKIEFVTCKACKRRSTKTDWNEHYFVCPQCGAYRPISADYRLDLILDKGTRNDLNPGIVAHDPLHFPDYKEKIERQNAKTGLEESAVTATGKIGGHKVVVAILDSRFFMGSMSTVVGEKVTRAIEYADENQLPLIIFSASGGARMQEGIYSLMQMAKTAAAIKKFSNNGGLYISYLTHPTTGGVTASFATLGDITLAEPHALVGFAGPRVIEQTIGRKLPKGFQRAEYLYEHGFVDRIVKRKEMRDVLVQLLALHSDKEVFS